MGKFFKVAAKKKQKREVLDSTAVIGGSLAVGGGMAYHKLPDHIKTRMRDIDVKPISPSERILLLHSHPAFGSGHKFQAEAFEKELRAKGFNNITSKPIQEFNPYFPDVKDILEDKYKAKRLAEVDSSTSEETRRLARRSWSTNELADGREASKGLAEELKNYDRVISFTGDTSMYMGEGFPNKLHKAISKSNIPIHLVATDRALSTADGWWDTPTVNRHTRPIKMYTSVHLPDSVAHENYINAYPEVRDKFKMGRGLAVDTSTTLNHVGEGIPSLKGRNSPYYFVHGGSTGVNVASTARMLEEHHKQGLLKGDALIVLGKSSVDEAGKAHIKNWANQVNSSGGAHKIHVVDALDKNTMNRALRDSVHNFTAGGTSYEELASLGKPSFFTYSKAASQFSHVGSLADVEGLTTYHEEIEGNPDLKRKLTEVLSKPISTLSPEISKKRGLAHLSGSEIIDTDNYTNFKNSIEEFEKTHADRIKISQANKHLAGQGSVDLLSELSKGFKNRRARGYLIHSGLGKGLAIAGGAAAFAGAADYLRNRYKMQKQAQIFQQADTALEVYKDDLKKDIKHLHREYKDEKKRTSLLVPLSIGGTAGAGAGITAYYTLPVLKDFKNLNFSQIGPKRFHTYVDLLRSNSDVRHSEVQKTMNAAKAAKAAESGTKFRFKI